MNPKYIFLLVIIASLYSFSFSQNKNNRGVVNIVFQDAPKGCVVVQTNKYIPEKHTSKRITLDSTEIVNGKYSYRYENRESDVALSEFAKFFVYNENGKKKDIIIKNPYDNGYCGTIILDNSISTISIINSQKLYGTMSGSLDNDVYMKLIADRNSDNPKYVSKQSGKINNYEFVRFNNKSNYLLKEIYQYRNDYSTIDSLKTIYELFDSTIKDSKTGRKLSQFIKTQYNIGKAGISNLFAFYDVNNKKYDFNGFISDKKLGVLIFWASWCGPCRRELPEIRKLVHSYNEEVAFVSLSIDLNKNEWLKAVKQDSVEWLSLARFPITPKSVSNSFNINTVPSIIVVDKQGKILYKDINGYGVIDDVYAVINKYLAIKK